MRVHENKTVRKEILDLLKVEGTRRGRGWSISRLVCCPRRSYWWKSGAEWKPDDRDALELTFSRGRAHHNILQVYKDAEKEIRKDGIVGHYDLRNRRIIEIFTTTLGSSRVKSLKNVPNVFRIKVKQLMCYLHMEGDTEGDLMVFFLFGDYKRPIKPELKVYTLYFEDLELENNWNSVLDMRANIEERVSIKLPPDDMGEPYECINCGYKYLCVEFLTSKYNEKVLEYIDYLKNGGVKL